MAETKRLSKPEASAPAKSSFFANVLSPKEMADHENQRGKNAMFRYAAKIGDISHVKRMLKRGASINEGDDEGWTALMLAAYNNRFEICRILIKQNAIIDARNSDGRTALMLAVQKDNMNICRLLIANGADVGATDNYSRTALDYAGNYGGRKPTELVKTRLIYAVLDRMFGKKAVRAFHSRFNECIKGGG